MVIIMLFQSRVYNNARILAIVVMCWILCVMCYVLCVMLMRPDASAGLVELIPAECNERRDALS